MSKDETETDDACLDVAARLDRIGRRKRDKRVAEWPPPHIEIELGEDEWKHKVGFWKVEGGILRIEANKKGEYDPRNRQEISEAEIDAIRRIATFGIEE